MIISLKPIGVAQNKQKQHFGDWNKVVTDLVINKDYQSALTGLTGYSHIIVIYWLHQETACELRHVPQGKVGKVPEVGIFACRCPQRPNPIGLSTVKLIGIKGNIVKVKGLDVVDSTPILDIKPYTPQYDSVPNVKVPSWVSKLDY